MGETVTLLESRVKRAVERLRARDEMKRAMHDAADALEALGRELGSEPAREDA